MKHFARYVTVGVAISAALASVVNGEDESTKEEARAWLKALEEGADPKPAPDEKANQPKPAPSVPLADRSPKPAPAEKAEPPKPAASVPPADRTEEHKTEAKAGGFLSLLQRETLTDGWFGLGEKLEDRGIAVSFSLTEIFQTNVHGGTAMRARRGRHTGSWDLEVETDLEKLLKLKGGSLYVSAEGSWRDGLDGPSVGSVYGINADAGGNRSMDVTQLHYEQALFEEKLRIRVGKLDIGGGFECRGCPVAFDGNAFANDETAQFLNAALVNNPTIPMPDVGMGAVVYVQPLEWFYLSAGAADAQADGRETGFRTAFHREDYFFIMYETGVAPQIPSPAGQLQGTYRMGVWHDPQPKAHPSGSLKRDDVGFYVSGDQMLIKEKDDEDDTQGLGAFARYGYAGDDVNPVRIFWSAGGQYQGLIPRRDDDVVAVGWAQGRLDKAAGFTESHETVMEAYYNAAVTGWFNVTPSVQYVIHPGGMEAVKDAVVLGVRIQMSF